MYLCTDHKNKPTILASFSINARFNTTYTAHHEALHSTVSPSSCYFPLPCTSSKSLNPRVKYFNLCQILPYKNSFQNPSAQEPYRGSHCGLQLIHLVSLGARVNLRLVQRHPEEILPYMVFWIIACLYMQTTRTVF